MLFYTVNNLVLLVWAALFCFRKPSKVKNLVFVMIAFTQLFIIMAFRKQIGYDYNMYAVGFRNMARSGFDVLSYKDWEPGFVIFTKLLGMINIMDYQWYMVILSIIAIVPAALFIYKNSEAPWISTILYVNMFLFFMSMNFLRQMIALSLLMLAWHFMKKNKFILFAVIIIIASFFHQTVLIMLPAYFLVKIKPGIKELIIYAFILLWFYTASTNLIDLVTTFYHEEYNNSIFIKQGVAAVYSILPVFITAAAFVLVKAGTINLTNENKYLINLALIGTIMMITMSKHSIIERFSYYFIPAMILAAPMMFKALQAKGVKYTFAGGRTIDLTSDKSRKLLSVGFLIILLALSYFHFYYGLNENAHGAKEYTSWVSFLSFE